MKLPNHFDLIAPFYEIVIPAAHTEELVQIGNFPVDGYVLDIGGGTGRVAKLLGKIQNNIFILDASRAMLRMANDHKLIEKICGNAEEIPFRDNYFDRVILIDSFHHLRNHKTALDESWRVLKRDGLLILQEPDPEQWGGKAIAFFEKALFMRSHLFSAKAVLNIMADKKYESQTIKKSQFYWLIFKKL